MWRGRGGAVYLQLILVLTGGWAAVPWRRVAAAAGDLRASEWTEKAAAAEVTGLAWKRSLFYAPGSRFPIHVGWRID